MGEAGEEHCARMNVLTEVVDWFSDPANWSGEAGIPARVFEHVQLSAFSVVAAALVALPVGMAIGHTRRGEFVAVTISNFGRAVPSFAILAITFPLLIQVELGFTLWPTFVALFFLAIPPMLTNAYVGIKGVDADTVEAARGMGLTGRQVLARVEAPLAAPLIVAGVRTSAVQVVATATLGAVIAWGGLGRFIIDGFKSQDDGMVLGGAILVALLAVLTELVLGLLQRAVTPRSQAAGLLPVAEPPPQPQPLTPG